jgi:hypothetical protein
MSDSVILFTLRFLRLTKKPRLAEFDESQIFEVLLNF